MLLIAQLQHRSTVVLTATTQHWMPKDPWQCISPAIIAVRAHSSMLGVQGLRCRRQLPKQQPEQPPEHEDVIVWHSPAGVWAAGLAAPRTALAATATATAKGTAGHTRVWLLLRLLLLLLLLPAKAAIGVPVTWPRQPPLAAALCFRLAAVGH